MAEDRFNEAFRRITAETPDPPPFSDLETHHATPAASIRFKPWMAATGAAVLVLIVVGLFGLLGGGGPDLAAPDEAMIDYVKLEYSATVNPVCEGGEIIDNGGFDEATIEIWGPNSDDLTLMVATFPDGSTERMIVEGEPLQPSHAWSSVPNTPFEMDGQSSFRTVLCEVGNSMGILVTPPYSATGLLPLTYLGVPTEPGWWVEGIESGDVTTEEYEGEEALQIRFEFDKGVGITKDGTEVMQAYFDANDPMKFLASVWMGESPSLGTWRMEVAWVESGEVLESSVSFSTDDFPYQIEGEPDPVTTTTVPPADCPVTIPSQAFTPPDGYPATPSDPDSVWFGKDELWTALSTDGTYDPRKSVWWSVNFPGGGVEPEPELRVRYVLLNSPRSLTFQTTAATNAQTDADGWFIIAGLDTRYAGCWEVTAMYKDASLSYVYYDPDGADPQPIVPDVIGMTVERAGNVLHDSGYEASFHDSANPMYEVCAQEPGAGLEIDPGETIGMRTAPPGGCGELMDGPIDLNPNYDTYADRFGRVWYLTACPNADVMVSGGVDAADGLPMVGQTWQDRIEGLLSGGSDPVLAGFGVTSVSAVPRGGEVWDRNADGNVVVRRVPDHMLQVTLEDESPCPSAPYFWNGIPVAFIFDPVPPTADVCPETVDQTSSSQIVVHFNCGADSNEPDPVGVARPLPPDENRITATLHALLAGPTDAEVARGFGSFFGDDSAHALVSTVLDGGQLVVDFNEDIAVNNASTSTGSQFFLAELLANAFQFEEVRSVEFRINGSCEAFWEFLQAGPTCNVIDRP